MEKWKNEKWKFGQLKKCEEWEKMIPHVVPYGTIGSPPPQRWGPEPVGIIFSLGFSTFEKGH